MLAIIVVIIIFYNIRNKSCECDKTQYNTQIIKNENSVSPVYSNHYSPSPDQDFIKEVILEEVKEEVILEEVKEEVILEEEVKEEVILEEDVKEEEVLDLQEKEDILVDPRFFMFSKNETIVYEENQSINIELKPSNHIFQMYS